MSSQAGPGPQDSREVSDAKIMGAYKVAECPTFRWLGFENSSDSKIPGGGIGYLDRDYFQWFNLQILPSTKDVKETNSYVAPGDIVIKGNENDDKARLAFFSLCEIPSQTWNVKE